MVSVKERMVYTQHDLLVRELVNQFKDISQSYRSAVNGMRMQNLKMSMVVSMHPGI